MFHAPLALKFQFSTFKHVTVYENLVIKACISTRCELCAIRSFTYVFFLPFFLSSVGIIFMENDK